MTEQQNLVMEDALALNPGLLFLALFIGERVAGLLGIFLSIPTAGMIALWMTNIVVQIFLIATLFSQQAFFLALELTSAMALIPYLLVAAFAFKLALTGETYERDSSSRNKELIIAAIATAYSALMLWAGGLDKLLLSALILVPGTILFFMARREQGGKVFKFWELVLFTVTAIAAVSALVGLATGQIVL